MHILFFWVFGVSVLYSLVDLALCMFVRLSAFESQSPETEPVVSIQLSVPGSFTTSPVHLSLLGAQVLSWRTRILSLQGMNLLPSP